MVKREVAVPLVIVAIAVLALLMIAACGSNESDKTPSQILQDASVATRSASSFHVVGSGQTSGSTEQFDLHVAGAGVVEGSLTLSGTSVGLIVVNGTGYIKGRDFLQQFAGPQAAQLFEDNWVKLPQSSAAPITLGVAASTETKKLGDCLVTGLTGASLKKSNATVNGQSVIQLQGPTITLDVASSGSAYLVRVRTAGTRSAFDNCLSNALGGSSGSTSGSTAGSLDFDSWGVAVAITAPAHPIDASGISGG